MGKTNAEIQAEMIERRKQMGNKRITLWINNKMAEKAKSLAGMNQSQSMNIAIELGFFAMSLIKEHDRGLYLSLVEGELNLVQTKLQNLFTSEQPAPEATAPTIATDKPVNRSELAKRKEEQAYQLSQQGLSQPEISDKLGVSRSTVSRYLKKYRS